MVSHMNYKTAIRQHSLIRLMERTQDSLAVIEFVWDVCSSHTNYYWHQTHHYSDFTWVSWCLISLATQLFVQKLVQANIKETSKFCNICMGKCINIFRFSIRRGIHQSLVDSLNKRSVMQKTLTFHWLIYWTSIAKLASINWLHW